MRIDRVSRRAPVIVRRAGASAAPAGYAEPAAAATATPLWSALIVGEPVPRGPRHEVVIGAGTARLVHSLAARRWQRLAMAQLLNRRPLRPFAGPLALECRLWSAGAGAPLDDGLILELLERAAILATRGAIREKHLFAGVDVAGPRLALALTRLGEPS